MQVKEKHYENVGEDFEQVYEIYRRFCPAFKGVGEQYAYLIGVKG